MHFATIRNKEQTVRDSLCYIHETEPDRRSGSCHIDYLKTRIAPGVSEHCLQYLSAIVCCSLMPTLNSTGNTRRGWPPLISSGKVWKTRRGNGTSTKKWSLNAWRKRNRRLKRDLTRESFNGNPKPSAKSCTIDR